MGKLLLLSLLVLLIIFEVWSFDPESWRREKHRRRSHGHGRRTDRDRSWMPSRGHRRHWKPNFEFDFGFDGDSWFNFDIKWGNSWWDGPHVCYTREEKVDDDGSHLSGTSIMYHDSHDMFKVTKSRMTERGLVTTTEIYECCDGYSREDKDFGCPTEVPDYSLTEMLESLGLDEFIELINSTGLEEDVLDTENTILTVFVPENEAMKAYLPLVTARNIDGNLKDTPSSVVVVSQEISESVVDDARNLLLGHVMVGKMMSSKFENDQLLETTSPFKTSIRMNVYSGLPQKVITANCHRVTNADNVAANGVVHVVENVLTPVSDNLLDLIKKNPELSTLKTALGRSALGSMLKDENNHLTILAPTDSAFKKYADLLTKISSNTDCAENVLKNHILPFTLCSAAINGRVQAKNSLNNRLELSRDQDGKMYVESAQIVTSDLMATNGVLYIVDDVIVPNEALDILQLAEKNNLTEFGKLVDFAGLKKELRSAENLTVFIPSNEAIKALSATVRSKLTKDDQALREILLYHVVPEVIDRRRQMYNGLSLDTLQGSKLNINEYSEFLFGHQWIQTVQCSVIDRVNYKGCESAVYVVDKILTPPVGNVVDVLAQDDRFSVLMELLKMSQLADTLQETGPYTLFAPTDEAFKALGSDAVEELKDNPRTLKSVLMNHVTRDSICCAGLTRPKMFLSQKVRTISGVIVDIGQRYNGQYFIANAVMDECDVMATNGVVHVINEVITGRRSLPSFLDHFHFHF